MASSEEYYQTGICGGGWWNPGRSLFSPCSAPINDFIWLDSSLNNMDEHADQMKQDVTDINDTQYWSEYNFAGPDTIDMSYAFENSFAPNWPKMLPSPSPKQQLYTSTKHTNANVSLPFWDCWMGNDEMATHESHQLQAPVVMENQKPSIYENPTNEIGLVSPKIGNKDMMAQKLASGSTLPGTKRKGNTTTRDEVLKRPRFETPSSLPTFKVRKEKLGDRITALQQLVSPFGKTDTASVLHEAIEYIKFLHDQVSVLRTTYMQNGTPPNQSESKNAGSEGPKQDLKSRGLCLVPISSIFTVANETTADFWTPTFGGTMAFR